MADILAVDFTDNSVDGVLARFVITIYEGVGIAIKVLGCELLLLTCRNNLKLQRHVSEAIPTVKEDEQTCIDDGPSVGLKLVTRVPGANPKATSFCRLYATKSGLIRSRSFLYRLRAAWASSVSMTRMRYHSNHIGNNVTAYHETQNLPCVLSWPSSFPSNHSPQLSIPNSFPSQHPLLSLQHPPLHAEPQRASFASPDAQHLEQRSLI